MRLPIRWKFILSIGATLLVTYLALLSWDYWWQRETAELQMQDLASTRALGLATGMNDRLSAAQRQADSLVTALQTSLQNMSMTYFDDAVRNVRPIGELYVIRPNLTDAEGRPLVTHVINELGGLRGRALRGRGPGRGGAPPPDEGSGPEDRPPGRDSQRRGQRGSARGFFANVVPVNDPAAERELISRMTQADEPAWGPPRPDSALGQGLLAAYTAPVILNGRTRAAVIAVIDLGELEQYRPPPRGRGRGPASAPSTQSADASPTESVALLDEEGRRIWPPDRRGSQQRPETVIAQAQESGNTELVDDLRAALAGEHRIVSVKNLAALVPRSVADEVYAVALAPMTAPGWIVAAAIPEAQFMNRIVQRLWQRGLFLIAGLALLLGIVTLVSIRLTRPIENMASAVHQLAAGNLDAQVSGVNSRDELGELARAFNSMTRQLKQHVAALTEQTAARQSVEAELRIARQIQSDLLPRKFPPFPDHKEFELHAVNVAAKRVAGDFYDFFFAPNGMLTITIADVAGKGMPAALLMAVTRTIIRNLAMEGHSPAQIVERANTLLVQDITNSMFVTLFLCQYDTRTGRIVYVNAGHPHPYRFGLNGSPHQFGAVTGAILGVNPNDGDWAFEEREERLEPGETLLLYTDGVTEARAPDDSMLRDAGLEGLIRKYGDQSVETICRKFVEEVNRFQNGQQSDDITLLALRRTV